MKLILSSELLASIHTSGERAYPEEGAGFLLGLDGEARRVVPTWWSTRRTLGGESVYRTEDTGGTWVF